MPFDTQKIEELQSVARSKGLPADILLDITKDIESEVYGTTEKLILMKCLIPKERIPEEVFCRLTGLLLPSNKGIIMELKLEVLKWMISAYSFLEKFNGKFRYFYHFFSTLLPYDLLRPYVCNLMFVITQKSRCVTERHIKVIIKSIGKYGKEPCLLLLLNLYCAISPTYFRSTDLNIEEYHIEPLGVYPSLLKSVHPSYELVFHLHIPVEKADNSSALEVASFPEIYKEIMALKSSKSVSEILKSKYRRLLLTVEKDKNTEKKVWDYVLSAAYQDVNSSKTLRRILEIVEYTQHIFPDIPNFTEKLLLSWDNISTIDEVIELLQYEPICCLDTFRNKMCHFREMLIKSDVPVKCHLLSCLSKIYVNWVLIDNQSAVLCDGRFCSFDDCSEDIHIAHSPAIEVMKLGTYIDLICHDIISQDSNAFLINEILLHYHRVSRAHSSHLAQRKKMLSIHVPTSSVFSLSIFSSSACTLENFCHLIKRLAAECKHMQNEGNKYVVIAIHDFQKCHLNMQHVLLGKSSEDEDSFYLSPRKGIFKLREKCPDYENSFILHNHPAVLFTTLSTSHSEASENSNTESDKDRFLQHLKHLNENHYLSISTLLCHRYE